MNSVAMALDHLAAGADGHRVASAGDPGAGTDREPGELGVRAGLHAVRDRGADQDIEDGTLGGIDLQGRSLSLSG
jgi:hypothetical protein